MVNKEVLRMIKVIIAIGGVYCLWLLCRVFLFDIFTIPTDSMLPTLRPGDKIIVNKCLMGARIYTDFHFDRRGGVLHCFRTNGLRGIRHNDIVVFNMPYIDGQVKFKINYVYCKRCVALPGDSISIQNSFYKNNNFEGMLGVKEEQKLLAQTPDSLIPNYVMSTMPHDFHLPWNIKNFGPLYVPRKGDLISVTPKEAVLYREIIEWETGKDIVADWDGGKVMLGKRRLFKYHFKHDYYFLVGDHVVNSQDARYWGMVPDDYIVGVVSKSF